MSRAAPICLAAEQAKATASSPPLHKGGTASRDFTRYSAASVLAAARRGWKMQ